MARKGALTEPGVAARLKSNRAVGIARRLRKTMTRAEKALWRALQRDAPEGMHFRKQAPIGPFVVDFVSHAAKLVIELEGGAHDAHDVALRDADRRTWIEGRGYLVLRLANADVLADPANIAARVVAEARMRLAER